MKMRWLAFLLAAMGVLSVAGCGGGGGGGGDEGRIRARYRQMANGLERERLDEVMRVFSFEYLNDGETRDDVTLGLGALLEDFEDIEVEQEFHNIRVLGNTATVFYTERILARDVSTGRIVESIEDFDDVWRYERGDWFLYGNQREAFVKKGFSRYSPARVRAHIKTPAQ